MLQTMASLVRAKDLVLDVEANIGNHSLYLASVVGCQVEAFEPNPELCEALEQSVALNDLADRQKVHSVGIGSQKGKARFSEPNPDNLGAQALTLVEGKTGEECYDIITLDSLEFSLPVRLIKVDVEGMELDVLEGASDLLRWDGPALFVEAMSEDAFDALKKLLSDLGYRYQNTFSATPTHLFLHESELTTSQGQTRSAQSHEHLREELQSTKYRLANANKKYREANERIGSLKEKLDTANNKYRQVTVDYDELKNQKLMLEERLKDFTARVPSGEKSADDRCDGLGNEEAMERENDNALTKNILHLREQCVEQSYPFTVLQFGISPDTLPFAQALNHGGSGHFYCVAEPSQTLDALRARLRDEGLESVVTVLPGPLEGWAYRYPDGCDSDLKRWFAESVLEQLPPLDWVVVDGPDWQGQPCTRYPALPSVLDRLAPGAEVWMLGAQDSRVQSVVNARCQDYGFTATAPDEAGVVSLTR